MIESSKVQKCFTKTPLIRYITQFWRRQRITDNVPKKFEKTPNKNPLYFVMNCRDDGDGAR
jgi:hypothetical protein